jgi:5,10-methylenetetrahydromethanopterin reductase
MTIQELSDGRAILGIGPGGSIALDPLGIVRQRPLGRTRDAVRVIRAVSRGVPTEGFTPPADPFSVWNLPIYVGARGEGFNRYASAEADGVFVGGVPMPNHELVIGWARSVRPVDVALYVNGIFDPATEERVRPRLIFGLLDAPAQFREALGLRLDDVRIAADALVAGDSSLALDLVSDEVFDALSLHGSPEVIGAGLAQLVKTHRPASIGLAILVDDPISALDPVAAAFQHMKEVLA